MSTDAVEKILQLRIVPVVSIEKSVNAAPLAEALVNAGLPIAEITLRTPESLEALRIAAQNPDLLVGVGSLQSAQDLDRAFNLGAQFAVSAGFSLAIAQKASALKIPYFPGVATPTEILQAIDSGLDRVKFFPAEALGGTATIKAISAPFPQVSFMPTGGVTADNAAGYLSLPNVIAVGGSWMVSPTLLNAGDFDAIERLAREAREAFAK
jgi:2-dehydro-3-deoxyphosphogluconate aldolase/(4S)-4-hydroxy-2-oxoglutarate aldolase